MKKRVRRLEKNTNQNHINNFIKIRVFISSICNKKYNDVRKQAKKLLEKTNLFKVYIFEDGKASSKKVNEEYLGYLSKSDICIIFIDNKDGITEPVLNEIQCAKGNDSIHKLFFFCDENSKVETTVQKELNNSMKERYEIIHKFSEFPNKVFESVMQDLASWYCFNYSYNNDKYKDITKEMIVNQEILLPKKIIDNYSCVRKTLLEELFNIKVSDKNDNYSKIDLELSNFLPVILNKKKFNLNEHLIMKDDISKLHKGKIREIINKRYEIQSLFFNYKYNECLDKLDSLIKYSEKVNIPNWIISDIAIDLRYIENLINEKNNVIMSETNGQKYLDNNKNAIFYPLLDRKKYEYEDKVNKEYRISINESPYQNRFNNIEYIIYPLADAYCISQIYGSIVQTQIIKTKLGDVYSCLLSEYTNHKFLIEYIRLLIIERDIKMLTRMIETYSKQYYIISNQEILDILKDIDYITDKDHREWSKYITLGTFGYYLNDNDFNIYASNAIKNVYNWKRSKKQIYNAWQYIYYFISHTFERLDINTISDLLYEIINSKCCVAHYRDYFKLLEKIDYSKLNKNIQEKFLNLYKKIIAGEYIENININEFADVIVIFFKTASVDTLEIEELIKEKHEKFYNNEFSLEFTDFAKVESEKWIIKLIDESKKRYDKNIKSVVIEFGYNPIITIYNILYSNKVKLSNSTIDNICDTLVKILINPNEIITIKLSVIKLIQLLKNKYIDSDKWLLVKKTIANENTVSKISDNYIFDKSKKYHLILAYYLLLNDDSEYFEKINDILLLNMEKETYDFIAELRIIQYVVELNTKMSDNLTMLLFHYSYSKTCHKEFSVRFLSIKCLIYFTNYNCTRKKAIISLSNIFENCTPELKVAILARLNKIKRTDKKFIDYIEKKGRIDSHYLVRKIAEGTR